MKFTFAPESRPLEGFTIKRAIYRGGFGEVYYAQSDAGREVALKLLMNNADIELRGVQQCLNLSHPNLVTIFDVRKDGDGDNWIVMEYVSGGTLDTLLRKSSQGLPVETVRQWLQGMTSGLSYLHSCGLVHRDMKPANVFMENGVVKIGDVGLSKFISPSRHSAQTQSVGTVHYMAPEVAKGKYGREVDVYAMGVMLYEMLTGELPFDGESTGEILMKHLSEEPDLQKLPPRLRSVISKALEKDPANRFSRVEALQRAFDDAVLGINSLPEDKQPEQKQSVQAAAEPAQSEPAGYATLPGTNHDHSSLVKSPLFSPKLIGWSAAALFCLFTMRMGVGMTFARLFLLMGVGGAAYFFMSKLKTRHQQSRPYRPTQVSTPPRRRSSRIAVGKSELFGSLFATVPISAALIGCLTVLKPTLLGTSSSLESLDLGTLGLFSAVTLVSSWLIILLPHLTGKHRRQKKISAVHWSILGTGIGAIAYLLDDYLMVGSLGDGGGAMFRSLGDQPLLVESGPTLFGYLAFFATFLGLRNWQSTTSPFRHNRFSISSVLITVFLAWFATAMFSFPHELAIAWGVIISCVTQLAAPMQERLSRFRRVA